MVKECNWFGYRAIEFEFEGRRARLAFPEKADEAKNWTLKTEYDEAYPREECALLAEGFHAAYLKNKTRFATPEDCDAKARFVKYLHEEYGLRDKCVPVGMSCGGGHAVNFAGYHPECVVCMFIDAPVLNFASFPAKAYPGIWRDEFTAAYPGVTKADLLAGFEYHPMNRIPALKVHRIPIIMVYGTNDTTVDYFDNGQFMEEAYADAPELLTVIKHNYRGHHPHGRMEERDRRITDFILAHV